MRFSKKEVTVVKAVHSNQPIVSLETYSGGQGCKQEHFKCLKAESINLLQWNIQERITSHAQAYLSNIKWTFVCERVTKQLALSNIDVHTDENTRQKQSQNHRR